MLVAAPPVKTVIYARQSMDNAEGIERQLERCRLLASARGWEVSQEFVDNAVSASKSREGAWQDLLSSGAKVVIAVDLDRLLRSTKDLITLEEAGLRVLTVDGEIDLTTADGEFRATMLAGIARFEVRRKSERQIRANEKRSLSGLPTAGKRRFGYLSGNTLEHPEEGPLTRQLFERVRDGEAIYKLAKELGKDTVTVRGILTNRSYSGWVRRKGVWFEAAPEVARVVPPELFEEVQAILSDPARRISPGGQVAYLASGLARCGVCGGPLNSRSQNYLCTEDLSHPCIKKDLLDDVLKWEVFTRVIVPAQEKVDGNLRELNAERAERLKERADLTELLTMPGVDRKVIALKLGALAGVLEALDQEASKVRSSQVAAELIGDLRGAFASDMTDEEGAAWWSKEWDALMLETRRELVRSLRVSVHPGRGVERVEVTGS